jgi:hypothetical protein
VAPDAGHRDILKLERVLYIYQLLFIHGPQPARASNRDGEKAMAGKGTIPCASLPHPSMAKKIRTPSEVHELTSADEYSTLSVSSHIS